MRINPYQALGIPPHSSTDTIKSTYRDLARRFHPDTGGVTADPERFQIVHEAYKTLMDPEKKSVFDRMTRNRADTSQRRRRPPGFPGSGMAHYQGTCTCGVVRMDTIPEVFGPLDDESIFRACYRCGRTVELERQGIHDDRVDPFDRSNRQKATEEATENERRRSNSTGAAEHEARRQAESRAEAGKAAAEFLRNIGMSTDDLADAFRRFGQAAREAERHVEDAATDPGPPPDDGGTWTLIQIIGEDGLLETRWVRLE